ncbi:MAG: TIGR00266 family protein, partial [Polyangiales bacterium]
MTTTLQHQIEHRPDFSLLRVELAPGQKIFAEPSAMVTMAPDIQMKAGFRGGVLATVGRAFAGESLIVNTFTAGSQGGEVSFAPGPMGDMVHHPLDGSLDVMLQKGAFVAHGDGVDISASWQGARGFFSGEGMILLKASGQGDLFFNTYGALIEVEVNGNYSVDTGYVVAFESSLNYHVGILPGTNLGGKLKSFLFGGEMLVCHFSGRGKLWVQTRAVMPFLRWVWPYRPQ